MEVDERLARLEAIVADEDSISKFERKGLRITKSVLLVVALAAPIVWALFEFILFLINRFQTLKHALNW